MLFIGFQKLEFHTIFTFALVQCERINLMTYLYGT